MNEPAATSTTASDDVAAGAVHISSDGFAALKRRYIGYHFTSRHPKGQISSGEIRDLVWLGNDIFAKIKWKGQRALDVQKLSALVGMPQAELEALAANNAPLPSEVAVASSVKMVTPVPIAPRVSSMPDVQFRHPNASFHPFYNPNMVRSPQQQQPGPIQPTQLHSQHQSHQPHQPHQAPPQPLQPQQPFSQLAMQAPLQPATAASSASAAAASSMSSLSAGTGETGEDRPLSRRRDFVGRKLVKRVPPDSFRIGQVLDIFRDPGTKKLMASVMWEGDSAPVAQTMDSVRRLLQSTEDERRLERWVGENQGPFPRHASPMDELSAQHSARFDSLQSSTLMGHELIGKIVVEQVQHKIMVGRIVDVFQDAAGYMMSRIKWDQSDEPVIQSLESVRQLVAATAHEKRLERWVLARQVNSISPASQTETPALDEDSMQSASTYSDLLGRNGTRSEPAQISDESPGNGQASDSSVDAESVTDESLIRQENRTSESDNDEMAGMNMDDSMSQTQSSTASIATTACSVCAAAGRSVYACRVQLKHELPAHLVATHEGLHATASGHAISTSVDGDATPQRVAASQGMYSDMHRPLMFPPPPARIIPVPSGEEIDPSARTRGLVSNVEGTSLKPCSACRTAGLTPFICRIRLKHQTPNWDAVQAFESRALMQADAARFADSYCMSDPNPTRAKYIGRRFVKIKRSGEYAMGVVVDIYPCTNQKAGRRWTVLVENEDGSRAETSMDALLRLLRATQKEDRFTALELQRARLAGIGSGSHEGGSAMDGSFAHRQADPDESFEGSDGQAAGMNEGENGAPMRIATPEPRHERQVGVSVLGQKFVKYQRAGPALVGTVVRILPREPGERKLMVEVEYNNGTRDITSMEAAKKLIKATHTERRFAQLDEDGAGAGAAARGTGGDEDGGAANSDDESVLMDGASSADDQGDEESQLSSEEFSELQDGSAKKRARSSTPQEEDLFDLLVAIELGCIRPGNGALTVSRSRQTKMVVDLLEDGNLMYEGETFSSLSAFVSAFDLDISAEFGASKDDLFFNNAKSLSQVKREMDNKQRRANSHAGNGNGGGNSVSANRRSVMRTNVPTRSKRSEVLDLDIFPAAVRTMLEKFPELDCSLDGYPDEVKYEKLSERLKELEATGEGDSVLSEHRQALVNYFRQRLETVGFDGLTTAEFQIIRLYNIEAAVRAAAQHREQLKEKLAAHAGEDVAAILPVYSSKVQPLITPSTAPGVSAIFPHVKEATAMIDVELRADELLRSGTQLASKRGTSEAKRLNDAEHLRTECEKRLVDLEQEEKQFVQAHERQEQEASQRIEQLQAREAELLRELEQLQKTIKDQQATRQTQQREFENRKRRYVAQRLSTERKYQRALLRQERAKTNLDVLQKFTNYVAGMPTGSRLSNDTMTLIQNAVQNCEAYVTSHMHSTNLEVLRHQDTTVRLLYEAIRLIGRLASGSEHASVLNGYLERLEGRYQPSHSYNSNEVVAVPNATIQRLRSTARNCTTVLFDVKTLQHQVPKRMPERVARVLKVMKRVQEFAARFQQGRRSRSRDDEDEDEDVKPFGGPDNAAGALVSLPHSGEPDLWVHVFGEEAPAATTNVFWECVLLAHSEQYIEYLFDRTNLARDLQASQGEVFNPIKDTALFNIIGSDADLDLDLKLGFDDASGSAQSQCFANSVRAALSNVPAARMEELCALPAPSDSAKVLLWDRWKDEVWASSPDFAGVLEYVSIHSDLEVYCGQDGQEVSDEQLRVILELKKLVPAAKMPPSVAGSHRKPGKKKGKRSLNGGGAPVDDVWMSLKPFVGSSVRVPEYDGSKFLYGIMVWDHATNRPAVEMTDGAVLSFYQFEFKAGRRDRNPKKKVQIELPAHSWTTIMDVPHLTASASEGWEAPVPAAAAAPAAVPAVAGVEASGSAEAKVRFDSATPRAKGSRDSVATNSPVFPGRLSPTPASTLSVDACEEGELLPASGGLRGKRALSPTRSPGQQAKVAKAGARTTASAPTSTAEDDDAAAKEEEEEEEDDGLQTKLVDANALVSGPGWWEGLEFAGSDTFISAESLNASLAAATLACRGVDAVLTGVLHDAPAEQPSRIRNVFCVTRPPGHHAGRYGNTRGCSQNGFCLLNNVAIAAFYARVWHGLRRVAVVDIDAHFGNGTAELFEGDSDAFYASVHLQYEMPAAFFPSSDAVRLGEDKLSSNQVFVNVYPPRRWNNPFGGPDPRLRGRSGFRKGLTEKILPALEQFRPDIIFISAGFDGFEGDPLGSGLGLKPNDYDWTAREIIRAAERICDGKVVAVLEGGYDVSNATDGLARCTEAFISGMTARATDQAF